MNDDGGNDGGDLIPFPSNGSEGGNGSMSGSNDAQSGDEVKSKKSSRIGKRARLQAKEEDALRMKCAGLSDEMIAQQLGYANGSSAYKAYKRALDRRSPDPFMVDQWRALHLARYERLLTSVWERAMRDDDSAETALKVLAQEAKLMGLNLDRLEITGANGGPLQMGVMVISVPEDKEGYIETLRAARGALPASLAATGTNGNGNYSASMLPPGEYPTNGAAPTANGRNGRSIDDETDAESGDDE